MKTKIALGCLTVLLLSGCAHKMSESECQLANWQDVGYQDGLGGEEYTRVRDHQKSCSKFGVAVDGQAYERGYQRGNQAYCSSSNPFQTGLRGDTALSVCSSEGYRADYARGLGQYCRTNDPYQLGLRGEQYNNGCSPTFAKKYRSGQEIYQLKQDIKYLKSELSDMEVKLAKAEEQKDKDGYQTQINDMKKQIKRKRRKLEIKVAANAIENNSLKGLLDAL